MPHNKNHSDLRQDTYFLGRGRELHDLIKILQQGRHTLLTGPKGIGKSRLMLEAKMILSGKAKHIPNDDPEQDDRQVLPLDPEKHRILFIEHFVTLGACFREMIEKLYYNRDLRFDAIEERADLRTILKYFFRSGNVATESAIFESITKSNKHYLIFFDNLDRISPSQYTFLERLLGVSTVCSAVINVRESQAAKRIWASFSRIDLEPLPDHECTRLIEYFFKAYGLSAVDSLLYRREVLKASAGNPFHLKNMLWHGKQQGIVNVDEIRKLRKIDEGKYFNMGPLYIFGVAGFTLFKIYSIGMDNREFYIYFSGLGFLAYMAFRIFRPFFLFRPQNKL